MSRVGDKWSALVIALLGGGAMRFSALKRAIGGISRRMLTTTLRGLEREGLVKRTVYPMNPPQVDDGLTPLGRTLLEPVTALAVWAERHRAEVQRAREAFDPGPGPGPGPGSRPGLGPGLRRRAGPPGGPRRLAALRRGAAPLASGGQRRGRAIARVGHSRHGAARPPIAGVI